MLDIGFTVEIRLWSTAPHYLVRWLLPHEKHEHDSRGMVNIQTIKITTVRPVTFHTYILHDVHSNIVL